MLYGLMVGAGLGADTKLTRWLRSFSRMTWTISKDWRDATE